MITLVLVLDSKAGLELQVSNVAGDFHQNVGDQVWKGEKKIWILIDKHFVKFPPKPLASPATQLAPTPIVLKKKKEKKKKKKKKKLLYTYVLEKATV